MLREVRFIWSGFSPSRIRFVSVHGLAKKMPIWSVEFDVYSGDKFAYNL